MAGDPLPETPGESTWQVGLEDEAATVRLAEDVASFVRAGDLVTLSGDLGAGKTTFARALIRVLSREPDLDVPSPTFTLMQIYETGRFPIVHADLYRIKDPSELADLGWDEAADGALVLVEWPERAGGTLDADRLDIAFTLDLDQSQKFRGAILTGHGAFAVRLARAKALQTILTESGWISAERVFMLGDASSRLYERLIKPDGTSAILMVSPPRPDGPPVRFGKPYSAIARLAEDIRPFVAIDQGLRAHGFSAPEIYASDLEAGLAVLEDLGTEGVVDGQGPILDRYMEAVAALATLHSLDLPDTLPVAASETYRIPTYDIDALSIEAELILDWYAPHIASVSIASGAKAGFTNLWRQTVGEVLAARKTWTLRDYHSPNLIWLPEREGLARVGIIDFQDCVLGHPAYDVVSLLQDARVDVPDAAELKLLGHYARLRRQSDPQFDMAAFARAYAVLGAQRATKILGIFARLDKRDHKPNYLVHIPRIEAYLAKGLAHPALAELKGWYERHLPRALALEATPTA